MKISGDAYVEWIDDEAVVLDKATGEIHYLNPSAALVFALLSEVGYRGVKKQLMHQGLLRYWNKRKELKALMATLREKGLVVEG